MHRIKLVLGLAAFLALGLSACAPLPPLVTVSPPAEANAKIAEAMTAAPIAIARDATTTQPRSCEDWTTMRPHLVVFWPGGFDAAHFTTDHHTGYPFIMWDGTPFEHLMVPVYAQ